MLDSIQTCLPGHLTSVNETTHALNTSLVWPQSKFGNCRQKKELLSLPGMCCIPKAIVGWERRMWNVSTERELLSALEYFLFNP